jgi:hypothetical protein
MTTPPVAVTGPVVVTGGQAPAQAPAQADEFFPSFVQR